MAVILGGSSGIVFPDSTTIPAASVSSLLAPGATDTDNALTLQPGTEVIGTTGLRVNNSIVTTATVYLPSNTVAPAITGNTRDTQVLTVSTGTWTNSPTSYSYQWKRNGTTNIGTNANTYTCVTADIGYSIKCTVTATNGIGSTSVDSNSTVNITANTYTATYLVVAGGGGGAINGGGGGGAGGLLTGTLTFTPSTVYTATIGGGGAGFTQGSSSTLTGVTSTVGGGRGGSFNQGSVAGGSGGSGGGGGNQTEGTGGGGAGTAGQGNNGGSGTYAPGEGRKGGGGGGGAGAVGNNGIWNTTNAGSGGAGFASSITGSSVTYAGGGGGGSGNDGWGGSGGAGGGGYGGSAANGSVPAAGTANTGGGGGGGQPGGNQAAGGSGVIILSVPTSNYSGTKTGSPTITTSGSNTIIKFTSSGTYTA